MSIDEAIYAKVADAFCQALALDDDEVQLNSLVIDDLGAESLDFLDIAFRLERAFGIKIPRGEIQKAAERRSGEAFELEGKLTESGARALREALPEVDSVMIVPGLPVRDIPRLFTVQTFYNMVTSLLVTREQAAS